MHYRVRADGDWMFFSGWAVFVNTRQLIMTRRGGREGRGKRFRRRKEGGREGGEDRDTRGR